MNTITIGLDDAKSVFQIHAEDQSGRIILQKRVRRAQVAAFFAMLPHSRIGIEACGSAPLSQTKGVGPDAAGAGPRCAPYSGGRCEALR